MVKLKTVRWGNAILPKINETLLDYDGKTYKVIKVNQEQRTVVLKRLNLRFNALGGI